MLVALIMRPWLRKAKEPNVEPKVFADDVLIIATGARMFKRLARALDETHAYLNDRGT